MSTNPSRRLVDVLTDDVADLSPASGDAPRSGYERSRMAITRVQLQHVERILVARGSRSPDEFLRVLDERTPILGFFRWRWDTHARTSGPSGVLDTARDCFLERLRVTLAGCYADDATSARHDRMTAYLQARHEELDLLFGSYEQQYQRTTHEWTRVGAIQVAPVRPLASSLARYPLLLDGLARYGLAPDTPAIQIHVPTRFTQGESPWEPGRTILQLARHLRTIECSYGPCGVRALFGLSWQFDSVLGRRLGFTVVDTPDLPQNIMGAWYQLVNEDGSFNRKRLAHFEHHNVLPYRLKCGFRRC